MTYDEAVSRAETIIAQLEQAEAISLEEYHRLAKEATGLLQFCKQQIEKSYE
ncbi:MAG: exodeoxyribonuclease VII small subunit [Paludibacteraceae bacterium]|jgi:exodeoxyribonuclease VII small subunit|nr:exodeoxyribonuclease VII small subunit [Paludibacteraceae bacterium]MBQ6763769.1 exodeoxyribonuclease VII small subunit [Paludibacteraceae bacterium]MBR0064951.1 exodeoxyribonuclease VII small subunit [Paludibacteraceae bacterium]MBR4565040.1 exodeoxyribonuclease VII small subunit [Paludibacteraceae bacterium]